MLYAQAWAVQLTKASYGSAVTDNLPLAVLGPLAMNLVLLVALIVCGGWSLFRRYRGQQVGPRLRLAPLLSLGGFVGSLASLWFGVPGWAGFGFFAVAALVGFSVVVGGGLASLGPYLVAVAVAWGVVVALVGAESGPVLPGAASPYDGRSFGAALSVLLIGVVTWWLGERRRARGLTPVPPSGEPERFRALGRALMKETAIGGDQMPALLASLAGLVALLIASTVIDSLGLGWALAVLGGAFAYGLVAAEVNLRIWPGRPRRALELYAWLHLVERDRLPASALPLPTTQKQAEAWLRSNPETQDTAAVRSELLAWTGSVDEARAVADRLPDVSPWERFIRTSYRDYVDWVAGGTGDALGVAAAAAHLPERSAQRQEADASVALHVARSRLIGGADWLTPMVEARSRLGPVADGALRRLYWRGFVRTYLLVGLLAGLVLRALDALVRGAG